MKKKVLIVAVVLILLSLPAFAQVRFDIGLDVPFGLGTTTTGATDIGTALGEWKFIPVPDLAFHYNFDLGMVNLGLGIRMFTFVLESVLWPNLYTELKLGPVVIEAQVGGGLFAMFGLYNSATYGAVVIPDLSAWFTLGKNNAFRIGGGAIGFYAPNSLGTTMPFLIYLGFKVALEL